MAPLFCIFILVVYSSNHFTLPLQNSEELTPASLKKEDVINNDFAEV